MTQWTLFGWTLTLSRSQRTTAWPRVNGSWIHDADVSPGTKARYGAQCAECGYSLYAHHMNVIEQLRACSCYRPKEKP